MFQVKESDQVESDALFERSFWGSLTLNPPLYGADTPMSFFDPALDYGWNMRELGDLLKTKKIPGISGRCGECLLLSRVFEGVRTPWIF